jgi:hypothetical protein
VLADERISDGAKIVYGKIARLSFKTGYCWASNRFLDGTATGRTASRHVNELCEAGYVGIIQVERGRRMIYVCGVDSRVSGPPARNAEPTADKSAEPAADGGSTPLAKFGDPPRQKWRPPLAKFGDPPSPNLATEHLNINILKKQIKETEEFVFNAEPQDEKPIEKQEDAAKVYNKAREFWNEKGLKPECRDLIIRPANISDILRTFSHFSWAEIRNAIGNYAWHRLKAGPEFSEPPPYGTLDGFLKTGVDRYFDDDALDQQFMRRNG